MKKLFKINKKLKPAFFALILIMLLFPAPQSVMAETENEMLKKRIEKLEKELNELKTLMNKKIASEEKAAKPVVESPRHAEKRWASYQGSV